MTMKPWREIAVPHRDVLEGTFQQSEFAALRNLHRRPEPLGGSPPLPEQLW